MRVRIGFRVRTCRWFGTLALIAGLLAGTVGVLLPAATVLATPTGPKFLYDSDCSSGTISQTDFQTYLDQYAVIVYFGSSPCTVNLTSSLSIQGGVTQSINGAGHGLIFVGDADPTTNKAGTFADFLIDDGTTPSTLALQNVTVENGSMGIYGQYSTVDIDKSTISGNGLSISGDGILANNINVTNSTISNNSYGVDAFGSVTITNSTIAGNLYNGVESDGSAIVTSSTITGSQLSLYTFGATTVTASILDGNENCDVRGAFTDGGYNLVTPGYCSVTFNEPNVTSAQLNLLPLDNYGGSTDTVALGPGSVAIDAIPAATCVTYTYPNDSFYSNHPGITSDQRGTDRPQGTNCDVGAYEAPSIAVTTTPSSPDVTTGWFSASTLSGYADQVTVQLTANGMAGNEWVRCGSSPLESYGPGSLNQSHTFDATTVGAGGDYPDGSYAINGSGFGCEIDQSPNTGPGTPLGFSIDGLTSINVDTVAPTITSPVDGTTVTIGSTVPLTCADDTSGVASCQVTVTPPSGPPVVVGQGQNLPTGQSGTYTVTPNTIADNAGNQDTTALSYTVTGYPLVTLPGSTANVQQGYYALLRVTFMNGNQDIASRTLPVNSVSLVGPAESNPPQTIPFVHKLQFGVFSGQPGYQLGINTRNLARGTWTLNLQLGGPSPQPAQVTFTVY